MSQKGLDRGSGGQGSSGTGFVAAVGSDPSVDIIGECILPSNRLIPPFPRPAVGGWYSGVATIPVGVADLGNPLRKFDALEDEKRWLSGVAGTSRSGLEIFRLRKLAEECICLKGGIPGILEENPMRVGDDNPK